MDVDRVDSWPRHQQLIVSLFGLYGRQRGSIPISALIALLGDLGAEPAAVRSAVSRLKRRGVLESVRRDGVAAYAPSAQLQGVFAEGDQRIFRPRRAAVGEMWLLVAFTVPESQRHLRHKIRALLTRRGFGSVTPGLWIAPGWMSEPIQMELDRSGLSEFVDMFHAAHVGGAGLGANVAKWWDLPSLSLLYQDFLDQWEPVAQRWTEVAAEPADADQTSRSAFRDYLPLITQWRRLPYLDPGLPLEFLPAPWPGQAAAELFAVLRAQLEPWAEAHARSRLDHP